MKATRFRLIPVNQENLWINLPSSQSTSALMPTNLWWANPEAFQHCLYEAGISTVALCSYQWRSLFTHRPEDCCTADAR